MPYPITDQFDDPRGRWNEYVPYTFTEKYEDFGSVIADQQHVDVRSFEEQTWVLDPTSTGVNHDHIVGKIDERNGWSGLQITANGNPISATLTSSIPGDKVDVEHLHDLSMVLPDYNTFDRELTWVQLTSNPSGAFGSVGDSSKVYFSSADAQPAQVSLDLSLFTTDGFDPTSISGFRIHLEQQSDPPPAETLITLMAIRAVAATWTETSLDFNTRTKKLVVPVTLSGDEYRGNALRGAEFIRGDGSVNDPIPINGTYALVFSPGGELISDLLQNLTGIMGRERLARFLLAGVDNPTLHQLSNYNQISLIARKVDWEPEPEDLDNDDDTGSGTFLKFSLLWNSLKTLYFIEKITDSETSRTSEIVDHDFIDITLNPSYLYTFSVKLVGEIATIRIVHVDEYNAEIADVWTRTVNNSLLEAVPGRVGFAADLFSNDATIEAYIGAPTSYSTLISQKLVQRTPVDGGQLAAVSASDKNLWTSISGLGDDLFLDPTKTLSGFGSWRTAQGLITNTFVAEDWNQMYLRVALWVNGPIDHVNQPSIALTTAGGNKTLPMSALQPFQWNYLFFNLAIFHKHLEGLEYQISFLPSPRLNLFWVDNIVIGRRRVAWSMRAKQDAPFHYFASTINNKTGAVHLPRDERDIYLQYQAEALTEDAWVVNPNLFPRHAQLGLPIYDEGYERR